MCSSPGMQDRGFTLVEALVAMAVLSVAALGGM
ncbi:MAG TPA: type II secretion system protein [Vicinamibacterales bacterium]|nr:type II secretion system protein [Vicinamibacterales bacterium]